MVVLGTIIRETIGGIATARRMGFNPIFLGSSAAYTDLIHKLGKGAMDGLYATMSSANPYLDAADKNVSRWAVKYKTAFNEDPTVFSVYGYTLVDTFAEAATQAGKNLTPDTFVKAMETMKISNDIFGSPTLSFGPKKRLGSNETRLSQLQKKVYKSFRSSGERGGLRRVRLYRLYPVRRGGFQGGARHGKEYSVHLQAREPPQRVDQPVPSQGDDECAARAHREPAGRVQETARQGAHGHYPRKGPGPPEKTWEKQILRARSLHHDNSQRDTTTHDAAVLGGPLATHVLPGPKAF